MHQRHLSAADYFDCESTDYKTAAIRVAERTRFRRANVVPWWSETEASRTHAFAAQAKNLYELGVNMGASTPIGAISAKHE